ncbi:MAG: flavodoxin-dependent (E)-4-hydroxy-3-methylbut-2-enyl-diphosphate synthase [Clostridia bacterium]
MKTTKRVLVGGIPIGGGAPVSIQSMTNTRTEDIDATVAQIGALTEAGCEIVRISVYDKACVDAIPEIKRRTKLPLVADIHFDYRLAIGAMKNGIDKIRFNPGNIGSERNVQELTACARDMGVPIRVGVNSGSVEKDLLAEYGGPTAQALEKSALRHVQILEKQHFYDTVISVKASDVATTVEAYRYVSRHCDYPLHLGVTEAGGADAALVKGAMGIGALLLDGIGDTIRVSITGDVVQEVKAAKLILNAAGLRKQGVEIVSCPTCGRTRSDLTSIVDRVRDELDTIKNGRYLKVAIMGCAVNGPGEAREADIGIALGEGNGVIFKKGQKLMAATLDEAVAELIRQAKDMLV